MLLRETDTNHAANVDAILAAVPYGRVCCFRHFAADITYLEFHFGLLFLHVVGTGFSNFSLSLSADVFFSAEKKNIFRP